jgi:hypothetical protein
VGLNLKESKTREVDMTNKSRSHKSKFNFLGFKIHLRSFKDNPERFWVARQPSEDSRRELTRKVRASLEPQLTIKEAEEKLNSIWRGWGNYFRHSNANRIFDREHRRMKNLVSGYLRRKYRRGKHPMTMKRIYKIGKPLYQSIRPLSVLSGGKFNSGQLDLNLGRA